MNKKTLGIIGGAVIAAAVSIGVAWFQYGSKDAYLNALPQDAAAIVRVDFRELLDDADLSADEQQQLLRRLAEDLGADAADVQPGHSGLDLSRPLYAFASPSGSLGAVARVADQDDFRDLLTVLAARGDASEVTSQRGFSWCVVRQQWLLAFNGSKALLMGPAVGSAQDQLRPEMARLLEQGSQESGRQSPLCVQLRKSDAPVAVIVSPELLPSDARSLLARAGVRSAGDALLRLTVEPDDHELKMQLTVLAENDDVRQRLKEADALLCPLRAELLDYTHDDALAWMALNLRGDDLLPLLRRSEQLRLALITLNLVVDADLIIRSIDGDVAVEFSGLTPGALLGKDLPTAQLTARLTDTDFLRHAPTWGSQSLMPVRTLSPNDFAITLGRQPLYFGARDKVFYLGTMPVLAESSKDDANAYLRDHRKDIKGLRLYATLDIPAVLAASPEVASGPAAFLRSFERMTIGMKKTGTLEMTLSAPEGSSVLRSLLLR